MTNLVDRIMGRLSLYDPWVSAALLLAALGIVFAVVSLIRQRGGGGLGALVLASLAAGVGIVGQVRAEHEIEQGLAKLTSPRPVRIFIAEKSTLIALPGATQVELEHKRRLAYPFAQVVGREGVLAATLPLLLGAIAALRRPVVSRVLTGGFLAVALLCWLGALVISIGTPPTGGNGRVSCASPLLTHSPRPGSPPPRPARGSDTGIRTRVTLISRRTSGTTCSTRCCSRTKR